MPRIAGASIPKYRKHRATGQAVVVIGGSDHYLGPHGTKASRLEYDRLIGEWISAGRPSSIAKAADLTIAELCQRYKRHAESYYSHGGTIHNIGTACRTLRLRYRNTLASEFGPLALKAVRQQFVENGASRKYCNRLTDIIRRMYKWAAGEQLVAISTWQALTAVTGLRCGHTEAPENEPIGPVDDATVDATLPHLSSIVSAMVRLQRLTGMRPDEVCRLRPCEVDRSAEVWTFKPEHHKTAHRGRQRTVFIGPKGQDILRSYLLRDAESFCFVPAETVAKQLEKRHAKRKTPLSYGNRPGTNQIRRKPRRRAGQRYDVHSYRRAIHRACDAVDKLAHKQQSEVDADKRIFPRWSPNRLRHSAATEIRKRFGLEAAQVVLGHSAADVTQIYAERDLAKAAEVIKQVG
jgi:integrase